MGFSQAGCKIIWSNEIDNTACQVLRQNFKHEIIKKDIREIEELARVDIVTGGFPCQPFSIVGDMQGLQGKRGTLIFDALKIIKKIRPKVLVFENVKFLIHHNKGKTFKIIIDAIRAEGYYIKKKEMRADEYSDTPQKRTRVFIVCFRDVQVFQKFQFPERVEELKGAEEVLEPFQVENEIDFSRLKEKIKKSIEKKIKHDYTFFAVYNGTLDVSTNGVCHTLLTKAPSPNGGAGIHVFYQGKYRKLSVREYLNFQGFPKDFNMDNVSMSKGYELAGNAVVVPLIKKIAEKIKIAMN